MEETIRLIQCPRCNTDNQNNKTSAHISEDNCQVCCGAGVVPLPETGFICVNCKGKGLITVKNDEKTCQACNGMGIIII